MVSRHPAVLTLHNHAPTRDQWMWVALLDAPGSAALCSQTSLALHGMRVFAEEGSFIHLLVPHGARVRRLPGVSVHESRRFSEFDIHHAQGFPCTAAARSAIDAAAWHRWPRFAMTMMAAVVQQRVTTVQALDLALATCGRVRHKRYMRIALRDIAGGAESLGEIDVAAMCRQLWPPSTRPTGRPTGPSGRRRYLDCEWRLADGTVVVLEIDGAHHLQVEHWEADMRHLSCQYVIG